MIRRSQHHADNDGAICDGGSRDHSMRDMGEACTSVVRLSSARSALTFAPLTRWLRAGYAP